MILHFSNPRLLFKGTECDAIIYCEIAIYYDVTKTLYVLVHCLVSLSSHCHYEYVVSIDLMCITIVD